MNYNYYFEGYQNKIYVRYSLEKYKTKKSLLQAVKRHMEKTKTVVLGYVLYTDSSTYRTTYHKESYKVLDRFNYKAFFEYWRE